MATSKDGYAQAVEATVESMQSQLRSFDIGTYAWNMQCKYNSMVECLECLDDYDSLAIRENYLDKMAILVGFIQGLEFADSKKNSVRVKAFQAWLDFAELNRSFNEDSRIASQRSHDSDVREHLTELSMKLAGHQHTPKNDPWVVSK